MDTAAAIRRLETRLRQQWIARCALVAPIRQTRQRAGLSQVALAAKLGTPQPVIARWEQGHTLPSLRSLLRIARAVGCRVEIRFVPLEDMPGESPEAAETAQRSRKPAGR